MTLVSLFVAAMTWWTIATGQFDPQPLERTYILSGPQRWEGSVNKPVSLNCEAFIPRNNIIQGGVQVQEMRWMYKASGAQKFQEVQQSASRTNKVTIFTTNYNDKAQTKSSRLEFERVQGGNAGEYKCTVGGGVTYGGAESEIALVRIIPDMMIYPSVVNMELNKPFSITCNLSINPAQLYDTPGLGLNQKGQNVLRPVVKWTVSTQLGVDPDDVNRMQALYEDYARDPQTLTNLNIIVSRDGQTLRVANATTDHAGYYWCTFQSYSKSFTGHIKQRSIVRYGPRFQEAKLRHFNTTRTLKSFLGETVDIYCNIISLPFGVVQWYRKGNIPLQHSQQRYPLHPHKSDRYYYFQLDKYRNPTILRLNRVLYDDRDEYTCNVTAGGIRLSWSTLLKVKDKYSAFYPLGVILAQIGLIFGLIFGAERVYNPKGHSHSHHHHNHSNAHSHHSHTHTHTTHNDPLGRPLGSYGGGVLKNHGGGAGSLPRGIPSGAYENYQGNISQHGGTMPNVYLDSSNQQRMNSSMNIINNNNVNNYGGNSLSRIPSMPPISLLHMSDVSPNGRSPQSTNLLFASKGKI